jgi:hypothetical protein
MKEKCSWNVKRNSVKERNVVANTEKSVFGKEVKATKNFFFFFFFCHVILKIHGIGKDFLFVSEVSGSIDEFVLISVFLVTKI